MSAIRSRRERDRFVVWHPAFPVSADGPTYADAFTAYQEAVRAFFRNRAATKAAS